MQHDEHMLVYLQHLRTKDYDLFLVQLWSHVDYHYASHDPSHSLVNRIDDRLRSTGV